MTAALAGIRVLDLADASGALAGKLLAGLGADVVLAEPPAGSPLRALPPSWQGAPERERSLFFWFYAAGKRSVVADVDVIARLADAADVVIDTGPPGSGPAWRHGRERLVVAAITPFGQTGPRAGWRGSNLVAEAMGGMSGVNGHRDGPPLAALGLQAYHQAGVQAAIGVLAALLARESSGRGQLVDVSVQAAVAGALEHVPGLFHQAGVVPRRQGTLHWTRYFRLGRCRDGWVMHCTLGDWTSLLEWVKADGFGAEIDDPALEDTTQRRDQAERVFDALDAWAKSYTVAELYEGAQLRRIPYAAVRAPEALLGDEHLAARGFFVPLEHPDLGASLPFPGGPFRLGTEPWRVERPPRLGEHAKAVLSEWIR
jgi:crotonobetainyl-CoA:carnitine CoA-transferase CaiB-like acyl-CoA transferase